MNAVTNRPLFVPVSLFLGAALCQNALAQPKLAPDAPRRAPSFSVAELEQFLGGRTLISLDLKDATLEEVAAALSQASNQKIEARPPAPARRAVTPATAPLFTFSTSKTPFWEALRAWQIEAREASEMVAGAAIGEVAATVPSRYALTVVPNSLGLTRNTAGWWTQPDDSLADGRAVGAWPFLVIATDLKRSQDAGLTQTGLRDASRAAQIAAARAANPNTPETGGAKAPIALVPTPEIERWQDRLILDSQVLIDPKLNPSALRYEILEARDDKGNDLRYAGEAALARAIPPRYASDDYRSIASGATMRIPLRSKPEMGHRLVKLRGVLRFNVVTRSQHWETTDFNKPNGGIIFQSGGDFAVQFKEFKPSASGDYWRIDFEATSRGAHLEQMWKNRPAERVFLPQNGDELASHRRENWAFTIDFSVSDRNSNAGGGSWGSLLNFEAAAPISLVDENGATFSLFSNIHTTTVTHRALGKPAVVSSDSSPIPPEDVAQNWTYEEERHLAFDAPRDPATGRDVKMGKPVKLMLDLPLERREVAIPFEFTNLPLPPS